MTKRIVTLLLVFTLVFGLASALSFNASAATVESELDLFEAANGLWEKTVHEGAECVIDYADGTAHIYGSEVNKWPSCTANFSEAIVVTPGTALVYEVSFASGKISFVINGTNFNLLLTDNIESNTGDMYGGEYKGAVKFEDLAARVGTDADGNIAITSFQVYTVDGADCTASLKFVPGYEFPEVSEPEESEESEPADDESVPAEESEKADDTSVPATNDSSDVSESDDAKTPSNTWVWILVAAVVVIVVVVVVVVSKKKK